MKTFKILNSIHFTSRVDVKTTFTKPNSELSEKLKKVIWHREGILNLVSHLIWLTRREYRFYYNTELDKLNFPWPWTKSYLRFLYKVPSLRNVFSCDVYVVPFFIWRRHLNFAIIVIIDSIEKIPIDWSQMYEIKRIHIFM